MRIALAQIDVIVGDIEGNLLRALDATEQAATLGADVVVLPELTLTGYPPEDLLHKAYFIERSMAAAEAFGARAACPAVIGYAFGDAGGIRNAAAFVREGRIEAVYRKQLLPNYGVFDEERHFEPGGVDTIVEIAGERCAITICEDLWLPGPAASATAAGATVVLNLSASPFHAGKGVERERLFADRARENGIWIAFCNLVGGQDELVFDGRSAIIAPDGGVVARAACFAQDILITNVGGDAAGTPQRSEPMVEGDEETYAALVLGLYDYIAKNGFTDVVLGLSGGIDSALVAVIAADALGPEHVHGVLMPSRYSSRGSVRDAQDLARALGVEAIELPIEAVFAATLATLAPVFGDAPEDITEENLQARARGMLLMALSNKYGWLVLASGNKSELSVGYSTLYGDMVGGFAPIKDVFKTRAYELARWRNTQAEVIPASTLAKPPSAELKPDQTDQDTLPPYDVLDAILVAYVEQDRSAEDIAAAGHERATVERVIRMVDAAEYKRRQGPLGIKITPKAFGRDRRMPITNRFRG
jgi:NAD+ synthase (glutamine-hydrolysing)